VQSKQFRAPAEGTVVVEDLMVVPASGRLRGRIFHPDGSPAAGAIYSCASDSFQLFHPFDYPKTDAGGRFHIPAVLRNEPVDFWVLPEPNKVQIWTGLTAGEDDFLFRLNPNAFIELPAEWEKYHFIEGMARGISRTKVREEINFSIADLEGKTVSRDSDTFKGKVLLVNIFGTWCAPCQAEIPHLVRFRQKYGGRGLDVVGIAFERDSGELARMKVRERMEEHEVNYPILFGGEEKRQRVLSAIQGLECFAGYPTTFFIGRDGRVKDVKVNFLTVTPEITAWQIEQFERIIVRLLEEPAEPRLSADNLYSAGQGEELAAVMPGELPEYADLKAAIEAAYAKRDALLANSKGKARLTLEKQGHSEQAVERLQERIRGELHIDPSKVALLGRADWTVEWYNKGAKKRYDMLVKEAEQPAGAERLLLPEHKRIATDGKQGIHYNVGRGEAYINKPPSPRDNPTNLSDYFRIDRLYRPGPATLPEGLNRWQENGRVPTVSRERVEGHDCLKVKFTEGGDLSNGKKYEKSLAFWVVPKMSYSLIKMEFRSSRRTGGGEPPLMDGYYASYEESDKFQGIWLLKNVTMVYNLGPLRKKLTAHLWDTEIGVDIPESTFTFEGLGVPAGTLVYDKTQGSRPVITRYRPGAATDEPSGALESEPEAGDAPGQSDGDELLKFVLAENTKARSRIRSVSYRFELVSESTTDVQGDNLPPIIERGPRSIRFQLSGREYKRGRWRNSLMHSRQRVTMLQSGRQTEQDRSEHMVINDDFAVSWHVGNHYAYQFDHTSIADRSDRSRAHMVMLSIDPIEFGFGTEEHTLAEAYDIMKDKHRWTAQEGTYEGRQVYLVKQFSPQMSDPNQPVCLYVIDPAKGFLITHFTGRYYDGQLNHKYEVEVARVDGTDIWLASKVVEKHYRMAAHTSQYVPNLMSKATTVISDVKVNEVLGDELFTPAALSLTDDVCLIRETVDGGLAPMVKRDGGWQSSSPTKDPKADCLPPTPSGLNGFRK